MRVLAMDTSGKIASVAVVSETKKEAFAEVNTGLTHSQTLMPMCEDMLKNAALDIHDIDLFAVSNGPGSFTGLRIGMGAVKGMAYALNKPCVQVSSLEALAYNLIDFDGNVLAVAEARKNEAYAALFSVHDKKVERICEDSAINLSEISKLLSQSEKTVYIVGDGAEICYNRIKDCVDNAVLISPALRLQNAVSVGFAALNYYKDGIVSDAAGIRPVYIRQPQAVAERMQRLGLTDSNSDENEKR